MAKPPVRAAAAPSRLAAVQVPLAVLAVIATFIA